MSSLKSGTDSYDLLEKELEKLRIRKTVHCVFTLGIGIKSEVGLFCALC